MSIEKIAENASNDLSFLREEVEWLKKVLENRKSIQDDSPYELFKNIQLPQASDYNCVYAKLILRLQLTKEERLIIVLALVPYTNPFMLDSADKQPRAFGGINGKNHKGFIPTGETVMYILAGNDLAKRVALLQYFDKNHPFYKDNILYLGASNSDEPELSSPLLVSSDFVDLVLRGYVRKPDLRPDFPAKLLSTEMNWEDVVLPTATQNQLNEIELWLNHNKTLAKDGTIGKKIKPGFRALFYGPPGTGKTLSACLIGKKTGRDVYRVDLSTIVSKYIGETEKNLAKLFDRAEKKDWILFFDEADALFGKRTNVSDSHDRYANQEVSYLLQRIEYHEGLVILATNMKSNMDSAFLRRFQTIVYFPLPKPEERLLLWQKAFSESIPADKSIQLNEIAKKYELSGSLILNIVSHTTLKAINEKSAVITSNMLMEGITRELAKEGRTI